MLTTINTQEGKKAISKEKNMKNGWRKLQRRKKLHPPQRKELEVNFLKSLWSQSASRSSDRKARKPGSKLCTDNLARVGSLYNEVLL